MKRTYTIRVYNSTLDGKNEYTATGLLKLEEHFVSILDDNSHDPLLVVPTSVVEVIQHREEMPLKNLADLGVSILKGLK